MYITEDVPDITEETGYSEVSLYDADLYNTKAAPDSEENLRALVQRVQTDQYGYYEISNIYNGKEYHVLITRDGFVPFDSSSSNANRLLELPNESHTYDLTVGLRGGDLTGDSRINSEDLEELSKYYNQSVGTVTEGMTDDQKAVVAKQKLCDFNVDGIINALDRAYVLANLGTDVNTYSYAKLSAE